MDLATENHRSCFEERNWFVMNRGISREGPRGPTSGRLTTRPPDPAGKRVKALKAGGKVLAPIAHVKRGAPDRQLAGLFGGSGREWLRVLKMDVGTAVLWLALAIGALGQRMWSQLASLKRRVRRLEKQRSHGSMIGTLTMFFLGLCVAEVFRYGSNGQGSLILERENGSDVDSYIEERLSRMSEERDRKSSGSVESHEDVHHVVQLGKKMGSREEKKQLQKERFVDSEIEECEPLEPTIA